MYEYKNGINKNAISFYILFLIRKNLSFLVLSKINVFDEF